ncbi:hypothetical protein DMC01_07930 [Campylobacter troglodytis]|nr:hypothetical protein DMC01_07930 [Campylobacter troglodytis]
MTNKNEANNKASQKIQLTSDDVNRGYVNVEFKLPLRFIGEWEGIRASKIKSKDKDWLVELEQELHLIEASLTFFAKEAFHNDYVRTKYRESIKEMLNSIKNQAKAEKDINKLKDLAQQANKFRNEMMEDMRQKSTALGKTIAKTVKEKGQTFDEAIKGKLNKQNIIQAFDKLPEYKQLKIYKSIIKSSGKSNETLNAKISIAKNFAKGFAVLTVGYATYDLYVSENKFEAIISNGATIGGGIFGGSVGAWTGLICGPYAFMSVAALGFLGSVGGGYLGDKFVNDYIKDKIDSLLKEFNLE